MKIQFDEFLEKNLSPYDINISYQVLDNEKLLITLQHDLYQTESIFSKNEVLNKLFGIK